MCLFLMVPVFVLTLIGINVAGMPILQWWCLLGLLCVSTGFIISEVVLLWTQWSKEAEKDRAVDYSYVGDEEELCALYLSEDEDGLDHLDARHLRDEEDPRVEIRDDFFRGMTQEEIDRYIDGVF